MTPMIPTMPVKGFEDMQKLGQANMDTMLRMFSEWTKGWQTIAVEIGDYSKRSIETSTAHVEKLMSVKSMEQAMELQTSYAKRAYDDYMAQVAKVNGLYADLAKEAYKPVERAFQSVR